MMLEREVGWMALTSTVPAEAMGVNEVWNRAGGHNYFDSCKGLSWGFG